MKEPKDLDQNFIDNLLSASTPCGICTRLTLDPQSICPDCRKSLGELVESQE